MGDSKKPDTSAPQTAPELPHTLIKQYGISHRTPMAAGHLAASEATPDMPDVIESATSASASTESFQEDEKTAAAVDDILAKESDQLLAIEDAKTDKAAPPKRARKVWWRHKWIWWLLFLIIFGTAGMVAATPRTRYQVLNKAGVRSSASVAVYDSTTHLPLKKVTVHIDGQQAQTDKDGKARLTGLLLGSHTLTIERVAFAPISQHIVVGWGSNPLGDFSLTETGVQYTLQITDYVSGQPIAGAEADGSDVSALSDTTGKIVLAVSGTDLADVSVTIAKPGYRTESQTLKTGTTAVSSVVLVPDRKEVFVSKQSGKYDLYAMDLDGANKKVLLAGTGMERSTMALVVNSDGSQAVLASTRDNKTDSDGFLQTTITLVNVSTGASTAIDHALGVQLVDWVGNKLVYRITMPGVTATDPERYRLISYDTVSNVRTQLVAANQFNVVTSAGGIIYYALSSADPDAQLGLFRINPDGTNKVQITHDETWSALRTAYGTLMLQTPASWLTYAIGGAQPTQSVAPGSFTNYGYVQDATGKQALWVDSRDGKGVLLLHDITANSDKTLQAQDGIAYPVRWLNDTTAMYRLANSGETADYATSTLSGQPHKIADVTPTYGYSQAF